MDKYIKNVLNIGMQSILNLYINNISFNPDLGSTGILYSRNETKYINHFLPS
jgi:hypothetical protein